MHIIELDSWLWNAGVYSGSLMCERLSEPPDRKGKTRRQFPLRTHALSILLLVGDLSSASVTYHHMNRSVFCSCAYDTALRENLWEALRTRCAPQERDRCQSRSVCEEIELIILISSMQVAGLPPMSSEKRSYRSWLIGYSQIRQLWNAHAFSIAMPQSAM
jgi:hypothetical protein